MAAGTYKSTLRKRRQPDKMFALFLWLRRAAVFTVLAVGVTWVSAWFFLSDADVKSVQWTRDKILKTTADMGFVLEDILVEGIVNTDPEILKAVINMEKGDPLFALNPREARELIEKISWVREARVERRFPNTLYIHVTERVPTAFWQQNKKLKLLDEAGEIIPSERLSRFENLVVVVGEDAPLQMPALMEMVGAQPDIMSRLKAASWVGERRWDLTLNPEIEVKLPETSVPEALERLAQAQEQDRLLEKDIASIDLREPGRIVVRTRPGQVSDYKEGSI